MINYKELFINNSATIKEALQIIDNGSMQIALVIDNNEKLIGTLTDGDVRRGLLNNISLNSSIDPIINRSPTVSSIHDSIECITEKAIKNQLTKIPTLDNNGKVIGLKIIKDLIEIKQKPNKVVLMVGGLGSRLRPLTNNIPKPMLQVGNKPILETIILNFKKYGFINIVLCVGYKSDIIINYFGNGSNFGVNITYIYENKRMGTAGALSLLSRKPKEPFFVMNGDLLTNMNFQQMMDFHISNDSFATMGVREYDFQVPYGVVDLEGIYIRNIKEKPMHTFFVSGGIYILDQSVLNFVPDEQFFDMPTLLKNMIDLKKKTISFPIHEYWLDIGKISDYEQAQIDYKRDFK